MSTPWLTPLQGRDFLNAKRSVKILSDLLSTLRSTLDSEEERILLSSVIDDLEKFTRSESALSVRKGQSGEEIINEMRQNMRDLERAAPMLGQNLDSTRAFVRRVDRLLLLVDQADAPQSIRTSLVLQRAQIGVAPIFARHSLAKLCRDRLAAGGPVE